MSTPLPAVRSTPTPTCLIASVLFKPDYPRLPLSRQPDMSTRVRTASVHSAPDYPSQDENDPRQPIPDPTIQVTSTHTVIKN